MQTAISRSHKGYFKKFNSDTVFDIIINVALFLIALAVLYPLYFVVIASISDPSMVASGQVIFYPRGISLEGYRYILDDQRIWTGYANSIFYTVFATILSLLITIPAGYALSRRDMIGSKFIMKFLLVTKFFSGGLIPTYLVVSALGLVDTRLVLIVVGSFGLFNLILCRTFFINTLPYELQEAAEIDGCGIGRYFISVVLPLSKAIIAIMTLYYAVGQWNTYFEALIYLSDNKLYPLQLILRDILINGQALEADIAEDPEAYELMMQISNSIKYGVIIISSIPVLAMYPFVQKYFVKGVMVGSLKG